MLAVKSMDVRENFKEWCNKVISGETISFSMEELRAMESDDWKPTQKVLNWDETAGADLNH